METRQLIEATCPECRGPLTEVRDGEIVEYHCLVGHRYSPEGLLQAHYETQERALWAAVVGLEESARMVQAVAPHLTSNATPDLDQDAQNKQQQAKEVRRVLQELRPYRLP